MGLGFFGSPSTTFGSLTFSLWLKVFLKIGWRSWPCLCARFLKFWIGYSWGVSSSSCCRQSKGSSALTSPVSVRKVVEGWRNSIFCKFTFPGSEETPWQGLGDQDESSWSTSNDGGWHSVGLSGISSISRQFSFHSAPKEDEEEDLDVEEDDDSEEDISKSLFSAGFAWITILMNFVGFSFSAELFISGRSFFKISSPIFTFFSLSLSRSLSSWKVPVETFLPSGDGDALLRHAWSNSLVANISDNLKNLPDLALYLL